MTPGKWARVSGEEAHGLRRGAWYAVVGDSTSALVVLDVNRDNRPVNRSSLEFTEERPTKWSVVKRDPAAGAAQRASDAKLGLVYGVCPNCSSRAPLARDSLKETCSRCSTESEVDWDNPC